MRLQDFVKNLKVRISKGWGDLSLARKLFVKSKDNDLLSAWTDGIC